MGQEMISEAEELQILEDGYNGIDTPPPETPEGDQQYIPQEAAQAEPEDPWAGVPAVLRQQIEAISSKLSVIDKLETQVSQANKRVGAIQNEFYQAQKSARETPKAPTPEEMAKASKNAASWEELKGDFPDWAEAIEGKIAETTAKIPNIDDLREQVTSLTSGVDAVKQQIITNEALEVRLVGLIHPDWKTVTKSPEYQSWLQSQPDDVKQKAFYGKTADEAVDVLNRFKARQAKKETISRSNNARLERAAEIPAGQSRRPPKAEEDMTEEEYYQKMQKELWGE
jgi:hypothetical protein